VTLPDTGGPRLHIVTNDEVLAREGWVRVAVSVMEAGGDSVALHIRGPRSSGATIYELTTRLLADARRTGAWLVVNDRVDVALATEVGAVHAGRRSLPLGAVRELVGPDVQLGVSCHSGDEVAQARSEGADYAFVCTIFPTPTHPDERGIGVAGVGSTVARAEGLPLIAIGGVDVTRAGVVRDVGAYGVAVVRGVWDAEEPDLAVTAYVAALEARPTGAVTGSR
jgi:thiamine-phosphate pyrophosphorylase